MKRVRDTSALALADLQPSLGHREQIVMDALRAWVGEPPTSYELTKYLLKRNQAFDLNSTRPRLSNLLDKGLVETRDKRTCAVTGRTSYTWALVTRVPVPEPVAIELDFFGEENSENA